MAKRGRPFSDDPKNMRVTVRFTESEYEKIKQRSKESGVGILDYMRDILNDETIKRR